MLDAWLEIVGCVLRPARPRLAHCVLERDAHLAARQRLAQERASSIARCESRIESARAAVFAANDGVITFHMRELEREWLMLARSDPDDGLMDLWARIAPVSWIDRKRWRDGAASFRLDTAIALAADAEGVEAAELAIRSLRGALAPWGTHLGPRVRWRAFESDADTITGLLAEPLRAAQEALSLRAETSIVLSRARELERAVRDAAHARFPGRPELAGSLGHAAYFEAVWRATSLADRESPVAPLRDLWRSGYSLSAIDDDGVVLELPPLHGPFDGPRGA